MADRKTVIRRAVTMAKRGHATQDAVTALTSTGGSVRTLVDTVGLVGGGRHAARFHNHWLWIPTLTPPDEVRALGASSFNPATHTLEIADEEAEYSTAIITSLEYLLVLDHPNWWKTALNLVLDLATFERRTIEWSPTAATDGDRTYPNVIAAPIAAANLRSPSDVWDIELRQGDTANQYQWIPLDELGRGWRLEQERDVLQLHFPDGAAPAQAETLRLVTLQNIDQVTAHSDEVTADADWVAYLLLAKMAELHGNPANPNDEWTDVGNTGRVRAAGARITELGMLSGMRLRDDDRNFGGPKLSGYIRG